MSATVGPVAINTFREAVRDRVLYNLVLFALLMIATRKLRETSNTVLVAGQVGGTFLFGIIAAPPAWITPSVRDLALLSLFGVFAFVATTLAAIGIYGVMAYSVAQRTREIGIRMALGASPGRVLGLIGRRAAILIALGLLLGLAGALGLARLIASQLWGIQPTDPATFAIGPVQRPRPICGQLLARGQRPGR